jgi:predicted DsbA family dithiol-disulfide isomerase
LNLEAADIKVPVEVIDIDVQSETAMEYGIRGVPTLVMLDGNTEMKRMSGNKTVKELQDWVA